MCRLCFWCRRGVDENQQREREGCCVSYTAIAHGAAEGINVRNARYRYAYVLIAGMVATLAVVVTSLPTTFLPHGVCYNWNPSLIGLHLVSDGLIGAAYFSIPPALYYFAKRRGDLPFPWMFLLFALFIVACGSTHWMEVWTLWSPQYWLAGALKAFTAAASVPTAVTLILLLPRALALPSPEQLRRANESLALEIDERKRAEERLREMQAELEERVRARTSELQTSNERLLKEMETREGLEMEQVKLAAIVESSDDAIVGKTLDGTVTTWNRGAQRMFGYSGEEIVGRSIMLIVPDDRREEESEILSRLHQGHRVEHFETIRVAKDGRQVDVSLSVSPIRDPLGNIIGASKIARDVGLRKRAEEEREQLLWSERAARSEAERASRLKDEFVANLSHELRTPLNAILGWVQILRRNTKQVDEQLQHGLGVIERNTRAQAQLIDDLLDVSRIVSGRVRLDLQPVDLASVIETAADAVRPAAEAKEIKLQLILDPLSGPVTGDPARLQQIVWNLLSNAIKFTPKTGRVQVFLERVNSHLEITVSDNGEGIPPDFLPFVFERFRQASSDTTRRFGGLGLGLAIVRHLIELHGGTVKAKSAGVGRGARFILSLPVRAVMQQPDGGERAHPTASSRVAEIAPPSLSGVKVLVVDDEPDAREVVRLILTDSNAEVLTAASSQEALDLLHRERPDVLLSDIGMPNEDGYALLRRVRKLPSREGGDTPAVALTAFARTEDRRLALLAGFQMHVVKPADAAELVTVVASLAGRTGGT